MKKDEDIFNIFKDDQGKLNEKPSPRAWNRLEKKLDRRKTKQRKIFYYQAFAAASVALLLAMVTALSIFDNSPNNSLAIQTESSDNPSLVATNDTEIGMRDYHEPWIMTHDEQKEFSANDIKLQKLRNNQIAEVKSNSDKKLIPNKYKLDSTINNSLLAEALESKNFNGISERKGNQNLKSPVVSDVHPDNIESNLGKTGIVSPAPKIVVPSDDPSYSDDITEEELYFFDEAEPVEKATLSENEIESISRKDLPEMKNEDQGDWINNNQGSFVDRVTELEKERAAEMIEADKEDMIADSKERKEAAKKAKNKKSNSPALASKAEDEFKRVPEVTAATKPSVSRSETNTIDLDVATNDITYESLDQVTQIQDIQLFEWLIGEWVDEDGKSLNLNKDIS